MAKHQWKVVGWIVGIAVFVIVLLPALYMGCAMIQMNNPR